MSDLLDAPEPLMALGEYGAHKTFEGLTAVAARLQTLLLTRKGTHPNNPDLGVDLESYKFEYADTNTEIAIQTELDRQMRKWMPGLDQVEVDVEFHPDGAGGKKLIVRLKLERTLDARSRVFFEFTQNPSSRRLLSKVTF